MEKSMYKELLADEMTKASEIKKELEIIEQMVKDIPNNMMLGEAIRNYFSLGTKTRKMFHEG